MPREATTRVCRPLQRRVRSGLASEQEVTDVQLARQDLDDARADQQAILDDIFLVGTANLPSAQRLRLAKIRSQGTTWNMPVEYLVVDRSEQQWVRLREALANERISAELEEDPDATDQAHLASVRDDTDVSAAMTALETRLPEVRAAWEGAIGG